MTLNSRTYDSCTETSWYPSFEPFDNSQAFFPRASTVSTTCAVWTHSTVHKLRSSNSLMKKSKHCHDHHAQKSIWIKLRINIQSLSIHKYVIKSYNLLREQFAKFQTRFTRRGLNFKFKCNLSVWITLFYTWLCHKEYV